jgi:hypothetical protein
VQDGLNQNWLKIEIEIVNYAWHTYPQQLDLRSFQIGEVKPPKIPT